MSPSVGDWARGKEIGLSGYKRYQYCACPQCGAERWTVERNRFTAPSTTLCQTCNTNHAKRFHIGAVTKLSV